VSGLLANVKQVGLLFYSLMDWRWILDFSWQFIPYKGTLIFNTSLSYGTLVLTDGIAKPDIELRVE